MMLDAAGRKVADQAVQMPLATIKAFVTRTLAAGAPK
jgi:hypothetical protein